MKDRKWIRKGDMMVICVILLIAVLLFVPRLFQKEKAVAEIYADGQLKHEIVLDNVTDKMQIEENGVIILAENGKIRFKNSNCKDKICVNAGWIFSPAQTAACIPNKVVIVIRGKQNSLDAVTY